MSVAHFSLAQERTFEVDLSNIPSYRASVLNAERSCHAQTRFLSDKAKPEDVFQEHAQHSSTASGHLVTWIHHLKSTQRRHQLFSTNYCVYHLLTGAQSPAERLSSHHSVDVAVQSFFSIRCATPSLVWLCRQHQALRRGAAPYTQKHSAAMFNPEYVYSSHCQTPACSISTNYSSFVRLHLEGHMFQCVLEFLKFSRGCSSNTIWDRSWMQKIFQQRR